MAMETESGGTMRGGQPPIAATLPEPKAETLPLGPLDDASVLAWEEQPSTLNPAHRVVWIVMSVFGSAGNGGLQQLFEGRWPSGFRYEEIADACRELGLPHVAELFELLVDLFPAKILYELKGRQEWLWGRTPGSENIPDLVDAMNSPVLDCAREVEVAVINFAMKQMDSFPQVKSLLKNL